LLERAEVSGVSLAGIVKRVINAIMAARKQRRAAAELRSLSVDALKDIGLTPGEIDLVVRCNVRRCDHAAVRDPKAVDIPRLMS